jgi:hypothetical protein
VSQVPNNKMRSETAVAIVVTCGYVCFRNLGFEKLFFKLFFIYLLLKKLINKKYFSIKKKFSLISRKVFF